MDYDEIAINCKEVLLGERKKYLTHFRATMEKLPKSSKRWWSLNKQLLNKQAAPTLTPPLKNKEGLWCRTPKTKANAFAECWAEKCQLPPEVFEQFFACIMPVMSD